MRFSFALALLILAHSGHTESNISVYDSVSNLLDSISTARKAIESDYSDIVGENASPLSSWIALSRIFRQSTNAIFDKSLSAVLEYQDKLSNECVLSMMEFADDLSQQKNWTYRMIDAFGFPNSGLLDGSFANFGDFDECVNIHQELSHDDIYGQYCLIKFNFEVPTNNTRLTAKDRIFNTSGSELEGTLFEDFLSFAHYFKARHGRMGVCVPSSCSIDDVRTIVHSLIQVDKVFITVDNCQSNDDEKGFQLHQWAIIAVLTLMFALSIVATVVDRCFPLPLFEDSLWISMLRHFSINRNMNNLIETKAGDANNLAAINGIRFMTMCWLVYGHAYFIPIKETFRSSLFFIESLSDAKMNLIYNAWPAVDIFFIFSATLLSFHCFRNLKPDSHLNIFKMVVNRVMRLWPAVWLVIGIAFLVPNLAQGPLWPEIMEQQVNDCVNTWWRIPLFIANWFPRKHMCLLQTWYLSADMQLFIFSFVFIFLIFKYRTKAIVGLGIGTVIYSAALSIIFYIKKYEPAIQFNKIDENETYKDLFQIYLPTYIHLNPCIMGIITGYYMIKMKRQDKRIYTVVNLIGWVLSLAIMGVVIMSAYYFTNFEVSRIEKSLYAGFHRLFWSISSCFLMISLEMNQGGIISDFMKAKIFVPLSKLSFLLYLIHFIVTWARFASIREPLVANNISLFNEFIVNLVISLFLSLFFHLTVEVPLTSLYTTYIGQRTWPFGNICMDRYLVPESDINANDVEKKPVAGKQA